MTTARALALAALLAIFGAPQTPTAALDVRAFGAKGDGKTLDTDAINKAITAAHGAGGGTVRFPAGQYLSTSIHLQSHVGLFLDHGAAIVAAARRTTSTSRRRIRSTRFRITATATGTTRCCGATASRT